jgi:hypothetical protein
MWGHLAARCPQARRDRNVSPEHTAMTRDEVQRHLKVINSIRTFYEVVSSDFREDNHVAHANAYGKKG